MLKMKYVWALALAALCVGVVSGSAVAQDSWAVAGSDLPSALIWDETYDASVDAENDGATIWDSNYELWSCAGSTSGGITLIDTWGLDLVPLVSPTVGPGSTETFDFTVTAPPITGTFECDWVMSDGGSTFLTDLAEADVGITSFPDIPTGYWSFAETEACKGRVPYIVLGFPDGFYRPTVPIRRDAMAVFVRRGMDIAQSYPATATFPDVPTGFWAFEDVETLVDAGIVLGYPNGYYRPEYNVSRDQMAVYIARAKSYALTIPASPTFPDVPLDHWAVQEINGCVENGIVLGYPDGLYRPAADIDRAQLSVYCYRAFVRATAGAGTGVVLAGPGLTDVNPAAATFDGWSTQLIDPGYAYVAFDVAELDASLAVGGTWDITFDFRDASTPTTTGTTVTINVNAATITGASGTYFYVYTPVPALAAGDKLLAVIVEDRDGDLIELYRTVAFEDTT
jgi:hypothetical protein